MLLAFTQEPEPNPAPPQEPAPQEDTISMAELQAKLSEVTRAYSEADLLLSRTMEQLERSMDAGKEDLSPEQEMLLDAASTSQRLVTEMEELLEMLPSPPPGDGQGQGNSPQEGNTGGEQPQEEDGGKNQGNRPADGMPSPSHREGEQGGSTRLDSPLSDFLRDPRDGQWGKLPPRLQQAIDSASAEEVPLRYRRWLVEYHRQGRDPGE
ncbi:MAG: hypothetical protein ACYTEP_03730 [Planctomycetota bacterium]